MLCHGLGIDPQQKQIVLPGEVLLRRFRHLLGGGEMNESVPQIDRTAGESPDPLGFAPKRRRANFV